MELAVFRGRVRPSEGYSHDGDHERSPRISTRGKR
jgi:hypothetical protein